jgi:hypothetical protein
LLVVVSVELPLVVEVEPEVIVAPFLEKTLEVVHQQNLL